jgi:ABC-2 type transport system permease protein
VSLVLAQSLLGLLVGALIFRYPFQPMQWIALLVALVLTSVAFNGIYLAAALSVSQYRTFMVLASVSVPVLVFAAPSISTVRQLPVVLQWISVVNPVTYAVGAMRDSAIFGFGTAWPSMAILFAVAIAANGLAGRALLRRTRNL